MTIKTTLKQIADAMPAINALLACSKLPVKASYAVGKLAAACESEMVAYNKARNQAFLDAGCGVADDKYTHPDGAAALTAAAAKADELLDAEAELSALPLDIAQFGSAEVPGNSFFNLEWAMKEAPAE